MWSTAHLSVCTVLGQGLSSGQCCLAPLTLLCLVTKQADGMALVRVKHCRPSLYIKFHVDAENYDLAIIMTQCWWTKHVQYKAQVQNCITVSDNLLIDFFVLLPERRML